jgi:hypothetical protein
MMIAPGKDASINNHFQASATWGHPFPQHYFLATRLLGTNPSLLPRRQKKALHSATEIPEG